MTAPVSEFLLDCGGLPRAALLAYNQRPITSKTRDQKQSCCSGVRTKRAEPLPEVPPPLKPIDISDPRTWVLHPPVHHSQQVPLHKPRSAATLPVYRSRAA